MAEADTKNLDFYEKGWFAKLRPYYRLSHSDNERLQIVLRTKLAIKDDTTIDRCSEIAGIFEFFLYSSLFVDADPDLFERLLAKMMEAAEYPEDFKECAKFFFPWIYNYRYVPDFEREMKMRDLRCTESPIDYLVWTHTIRLMHDREPLKRLNIDMKNIEEIEREMRECDVLEYYRGVYLDDYAKPPYYLQDYWEDHGIDVDFLPK